MAHSKEYVDAMFKAAKSYLPSWVWQHLHKIAFPSSGGTARHRKEDFIEKQVSPMSPSGLSTEEIVAQLQIRGEQYSRTEAQYVQPTDDARVACGACRFFLRPPQGEIGLCQAVIGPIAWFGTCQFYISALDEAAFALAHIVQKQGSFQIQTILFPKARWTLQRARAWLSEHDWKDDKVDETENAYRFRQRDPGDFDEIRPVCLTPAGAAPNLQECRILAFGGQTEIEQEDADKAVHRDRDKRRRRRGSVYGSSHEKADAGLTEQEVAIEIDELMKWFDPGVQKQDEQPARALPVPTDAPITNEPWQGAREVAAMEVGRLRRSTLAFVGGDPEVKGNYKLPYRDRQGRINANAVRAIQAVLGGGRGGVDLPTAIQAGVRRNARRLMERIQERRVEQSQDGIDKQSAECVADRTASNRRSGMDGVSARREAVSYCESVGKSGLIKDIPIIKIDAEKRIVYGVVLDPYIIDTQGDWIPPAEVEETAHKWMKESRSIGLGHRKEAEATPVESYLLPYPDADDYRKAVNGQPHRIIKFKIGEGFVHSGSWVLATMIDDEATWELVKSGELGSYSIGGRGERTEIEVTQMPEVTEVIEADFSKAA